MISPQKTNEESLLPKLPLGTKYFDEETGKTWHYVKANEAITKGSVLTPLLALFDGDCDASAGNQLVDAAATFTSKTVGAYVTINAGTKGILDPANKVTKLVSTTELQLENDWSEDLTTSEDYVVMHPWLMEEADAAGEIIKGVAPIAVTTQYHFWMQTGGFCDNIRVDGNTSSNAVVANEGIVSSGTAGIATGFTNGGTTADEADKSNIVALVPTALAATTIPGELTCLP